MSKVDGKKTYIIAAITVVFALRIAANDIVQFGYVYEDTIRYIGTMIGLGGGIAAIRHGMKTGA